ncbi:MAG: hypothetical protein ACYDHO_02710, partial [Gaiellaceae bacterium]
MAIDTSDICNTIRQALKEALRGVPTQCYSMQERRDSVRAGRTAFEETVFDIIPQNGESAPVTIAYLDDFAQVGVDIGTTTSFELPVDDGWGPFGPTLEENIREVMAAVITGGVRARATRNQKNNALTVESQLRTPSGRMAEISHFSVYKNIERAAEWFPRE